MAVATHPDTFEGLMIGSDVLDGLIDDMVTGSASATKVRRDCENTLSDAKKMGATMELPALAGAKAAGTYGKHKGNIDRPEHHKPIDWVLGIETLTSLHLPASPATGVHLIHSFLCCAWSVGS